MDPKNIVLLAVKGSVVALRKDNGARLWATRLKGSLSSDFVSVAADETRVYAHTGGELFCLDLQTGNGLWQDELAGFGYGVASLALPGFPTTPATAPAERRRDDDASAATAANSGSH